MKQQISISDIVARPHLEHFNSELPHQLDHGGRRAYKSSKNGIKIAKRMMEDIHCEVVIAREDYSDHKHSTFPAMKRAFSRLGVKLVVGRHCSSDRSKDLWIKLPKGNMIHFRHMKEIDKLKGTEPYGEDNQIKIVWYFEITEFKSERYITEANATFMSGSQDYFWALYEWNDAPKLSHWTYKFARKYENRPDAYVKKTNYNDTPMWQQLKFLGQLLLNEINTLKGLDYEQWKSVYQGFPANLNGAVYKNFDRTRHVASERDPITHNYIDIVIGVDYGNNDATVFTVKGFVPKFTRMEVPSTWYHSNGESGDNYSINKYVEAFLEFASTVYMRYKKAITVQIDSANLAFIQLIEEASMSKQYHFLIIEPLHKMKKRKGTRKIKTVLQERADMNEIMLAADYILISPDCPELIGGFEEREYDKQGNPADNGSSDVNSIDSWDYTWIKDIDFIHDIILR